MNINKYLKKLNIDFQLDGDTFIFTLEDKTKKEIKKRFRTIFIYSNLNLTVNGSNNKIFQLRF